MNSKPACYQCPHRGSLPGDAHSSCQHPVLSHNAVDRILAPMHLMMGVQSASMRALDLHADPYGVASGWCLWPLNFDPIWIDQCNGYLPVSAPKVTGAEQA